MVERWSSTQRRADGGQRPATRRRRDRRETQSIRWMLGSSASASPATPPRGREGRARADRPAARGSRSPPSPGAPAIAPANASVAPPLTPTTTPGPWPRASRRGRRLAIEVVDGQGSRRIPAEPNDVGIPSFRTDERIEQPRPHADAVEEVDVAGHGAERGPRRRPRPARSWAAGWRRLSRGFPRRRRRTMSRSPSTDRVRCSWATRRLRSGRCRHDRSSGPAKTLKSPTPSPSSSIEEAVTGGFDQGPWSRHRRLGRHTDGAKQRTGHPHPGSRCGSRRCTRSRRSRRPPSSRRCRCTTRSRPSPIR